jgi:hypothetical protein
MAHPDQGRDEEIKAAKEAELAADRDEHMQKVGGGAYPQKYEEHRKAMDDL